MQLLIDRYRRATDTEAPAIRSHLVESLTVDYSKAIIDRHIIAAYREESKHMAASNPKWLLTQQDYRDLDGSDDANWEYVVAVHCLIKAFTPRTPSRIANSQLSYIDLVDRSVLGGLYPEWRTTQVTVPFMHQLVALIEFIVSISTDVLGIEEAWTRHAASKYLAILESRLTPLPPLTDSPARIQGAFTESWDPFLVSRSRVTAANKTNDRLIYLLAVALPSNDAEAQLLALLSFKA